MYYVLFVLEWIIKMFDKFGIVFEDNLIFIDEFI